MVLSTMDSARPPAPVARSPQAALSRTPGLRRSGSPTSIRPPPREGLSGGGGGDCVQEEAGHLFLLVLMAKLWDHLESGGLSRKYTALNNPERERYIEELTAEFFSVSMISFF